MPDFEKGDEFKDSLGHKFVVKKRLQDVDTGEIYYQMKHASLTDGGPDKSLVEEWELHNALIQINEDPDDEKPWI